MSSLSGLEQDFRDARVIVTGASGFIGFNMVQTLSRLNAKTLVIDRAQPPANIPNVEFEWADLRHLNRNYEADYLIHLAAVTNAGYAEKYPLDTYETNVLGTANLLQHVQIKKRVLFPSTALVYEASRSPIGEDAETDLTSVYPQTKSLGEQIIKFSCKRIGVDYTIVRFFNVFGPGQLPMYIVPQVLRQISEDHRRVVRNGAIMRDLLFVDDCIEAVLKLAVSPSAMNSVFNIGSGHIVSIADVATAAVGASGERGVEIVDLEQNIENSPTALIADISRVQATIDWSPKTNLEEGLRKMWNAM